MLSLALTVCPQEPFKSDGTLCSGNHYFIYLQETFETK